MNSVEPTSVESRLHSPAVLDTARRTDLAPLHPVMRDAVSMLVRTIESENLPFRVFETLRSPLRQDWLYQQGRSRSGSIVTYAQAWNSYHQYGLAVDFVLWINETWTWNTLGINAARWERLHALGKTVGLEPLKFETPHLQVAGLRIEELRAGKLPSGGDDSWHNTLEGAIISWSGKPPAPPIESLRPALSGDNTPAVE
jgi:peptidoglycan LD-endopeptidase CwlK